jgi:uncharacterized membrane protein (GlpM family)
VHNLLFQFVVPFLLSAIVVVIITFAAERYGTKTGGIIGTLPSTMLVAVATIAINKGVNFASNAVAIMPAEMGINIIFLLILVLLSRHSMYIAVVLSLALWSVASAVLFSLNVDNIILSMAIYASLMIPSLLFLEFFKKVPSSSRVTIRYTPSKILLRGLLAGTVVAIAVSLADVSAALSGIFSVFPAVFLSTMIIFIMEHGPDFAGAIAKSMIFGTPTIIGYATSVHFIYPVLGVLWGTVVAYILSLIIAVSLFKAVNTMK